MTLDMFLFLFIVIWHLHFLRMLSWVRLLFSMVVLSMVRLVVSNIMRILLTLKELTSSFIFHHLFADAVFTFDLLADAILAFDLGTRFLFSCVHFSIFTHLRWRGTWKAFRMDVAISSLKTMLKVGLSIFESVGHILLQMLEVIAHWLHWVLYLLFDLAEFTSKIIFGSRKRSTLIRFGSLSFSLLADSVSALSDNALAIFALLLRTLFALFGVHLAIITHLGLWWGWERLGVDIAMRWIKFERVFHLLHVFLNVSEGTETIIERWHVHEATATEVREVVTLTEVSHVREAPPLLLYTRNWWSKDSKGD